MLGAPALRLNGPTLEARGWGSRAREHPSGRVWHLRRIRVVLTPAVAISEPACVQPVAVEGWGPVRSTAPRRRFRKARAMRITNPR